MSSIPHDVAFQRIRLLFPEAIGICKYYGSYRSTSVVLPNGKSFCIPLEVQWPCGVGEFPQPEPKYREPTNDDVHRTIEVRDCRNDCWNERKLLLVRSDLHDKRFIIADEGEAIFAYRSARIKDEKTQ